MFHPIWRLSEPGADNLGLACNEDGLVLGRTPLIARRDGRFVVRDGRDLERLLGRAYRMNVDAGPLMGGLAAVASALNGADLLLARIAAVHLRIPDLPDRAARERLEAEDRLIKSTREGSLVAKTGDWNPALHPRAGTPPNPGWFAATDGAGSDSSATATAQSSASNDTANADESMRPGQKPDMPSGGGGGGFSGGRPVPVQQSGVRPLEDILAPNGKPVGVVNPGAEVNIRTVTPGEFDAIRSDLLSGATQIPGPRSYQGEVFQRPDGSVIGIRSSPENGITIDVLHSTNPTIPPGFKVHQR